MWEVAERFTVKLGGSTYINCKTLVTFRGEPLFNLRRHDDGYLGIDFDIYNTEGRKIATVRRNEIYYDGKDKDRFHIDGSENRYVLTDTKTGRTICDIRKRQAAEPAELDVSVHLYTPSGFLFDATPDRTNLPGGNAFINCTFADCGTGIAIE